MSLPYNLSTERRPTLGLVVLQADETIEADFRRLVPLSADLFVTRVPSAPDVTSETLAEMKSHLTAAAALFPRATQFDVIGYGCTSGTAEIGADRIADLVHAGARAAAVTEPVSALLAACHHLRITRLAFLSPYVAEVSEKLRRTLADEGIATDRFASFNEPLEANVARIDEQSLVDASKTLGSDADALFLSCTNLKTLGVIERLEEELGLPVLSSNFVLAWHMLKIAGVEAGPEANGILFGSDPRHARQQD